MEFLLLLQWVIISYMRVISYLKLGGQVVMRRLLLCQNLGNCPPCTPVTYAPELEFSINKSPIYKPNFIFAFFHNKIFESNKKNSWKQGWHKKFLVPPSSRSRTFFHSSIPQGIDSDPRGPCQNSLRTSKVLNFLFGHLNMKKMKISENFQKFVEIFLVFFFRITYQFLISLLNIPNFEI